MHIASIKKHTIVLGAGITGLSTAHYLSQKNKDFLVLEKNNRAGGNISSLAKEGFVVENGPNTVLLNNDSVIKLIKDYGLWNSVSQPLKTAENNRFVLMNDKLQLLPRNLLEFFKTPLLSWKQKLRLLKEPFIPAHASNTSVANFVSKRFGNGILNQFVEPFITGIYSGNTKNMSAEHTLKNLWNAEQKYGSVIKGLIKNQPKSKAKMFNLPKGLSQLTDAIAVKLTEHIHYNCQINSVTKTKEGYEIQTDKNTYVCETIISTLPAFALANYVNDDNLKCALNTVEYVPVDVFHFAFDKQDVKNQAQGFGVLSKESDNKHFLGILFNSRIFPHVSPKDKELFTVIIGGSRQKELCNLEYDTLENLVLKEVIDLMQCTKKPSFSNHYRYKKGIPQYDLNHHKLLKAIRNYEKNNSNFHILGNYFNGISVSDCILKSDKLIQHLN